jgi:hypothetical protein
MNNQDYPFNVDGGVFMKLLKTHFIYFSLVFSAFFVACSGGGDSGSGGTGTVAVSLTDAMSNKFKAVYVTIDDVQVHLKGNGNGNGNNSWKSVSAPNLPKTFNLYELTNGIREEIGLADLETGEYTQMRLIVGEMPDDGINDLSEAHPFGNYVIDTDHNYQELKIPSGYQTGIKIVHGFSIGTNQTTELIIDFNAEKSVVVAGNSGSWHLKPTIQVGTTEELSIIRGKVTSDGSTAIEGAVVSAQLFDETASDEKNKVVVQTSTITDSDGYFSLFVSPNEYNLVVYDDGKIPQYRMIDSLSAGETYTFPEDDIQLQDASPDIKNLTGELTISGGDYTEQFASLSFRQDATGQLIEVTSVDVLNGESYNINLPLGEYTVVAWTDGFDTQTHILNILGTDAEPIVTNISFPQ